MLNITYQEKTSSDKRCFFLWVAWSNYENLDQLSTQKSNQNIFEDFFFRPHLITFIGVFCLPSQLQKESWHQTDCCNEVWEIWLEDHNAIYHSFPPAAIFSRGTCLPASARLLLNLAHPAADHLTNFIRKVSHFGPTKRIVRGLPCLGFISFTSFSLSPISQKDVDS